MSGESSIELHFYISSREANAEALGKDISEHWSIESAPQAHEGFHNELKLCA
jgi:predicted transposase YbfD/YdcC